MTAPRTADGAARARSLLRSAPAASAACRAVRLASSTRPGSRPEIAGEEDAQQHSGGHPTPAPRWGPGSARRDPAPRGLSTAVARLAGSRRPAGPTTRGPLPSRGPAAGARASSSSHSALTGRQIVAVQRSRRGPPVAARLPRPMQIQPTAMPGLVAIEPDRPRRRAGLLRGDLPPQLARAGWGSRPPSRSSRTTTPARSAGCCGACTCSSATASPSWCAVRGDGSSTSGWTCGGARPRTGSGPAWSSTTRACASCTCRSASPTASASSARSPTWSTSRAPTTTPSSSGRSPGTIPRSRSSWPLPAQELIVSARDQAAPRLAEVAGELPFSWHP